MTISYPLTAPAEVVRAARFAPVLRRATAANESPFTGKQQTLSWPYARWEATLDVASSLRDKGAVVEAFIAALRGRYGTFLMGPLHALSPRGTVNLAGVQVDGAVAALANALPLKGLGAGKTLLRGDYLQLGTGANARLYLVVEDATANGSGLATVSVEPGLRVAALNNDPVVTQNMVGVWRLNTDAVGPAVAPGMVYDVVQLPCIEAL